MLKFIRKVLLFPFALFLWGHNSPAVYNGDKAFGQEHSETFYLKHNYYGGDHNRCTGVLIDENVILTAGHCLEFIGLESDTVAMTNDSSGYLSKMDVVSMHLHKNYKSPLSETFFAHQVQYDLGIIIFKKNLTKKFNAVPVKISSTFEETKNLLLVTIENKIFGLGFGITSRLPQRITKKERRSLPVKVQIDADNNILRALSMKESAGLCDGDSGGGLFVLDSKGTKILIGILSGVTSRDRCDEPNNQAYFSMPSLNYCWIKKFLSPKQRGNISVEGLCKE